MLPYLDCGLYLTDAGIETTLVFLENVPLRDFAAFELIETEEGRERLKRYYRRHAAIAAAHGAGFVFEAPTWRASADWGGRLGYDADDLRRINGGAVAMMRELRDAYARETGLPAVASATIGPRGDGYAPDVTMTAEEAETYHRPQVRALVEAGAEMATALTLPYPEEAIGIARAASAEGLPIALSFTVETDGRLPSGQSLAQAVGAVDAATGQGPLYSMINCAHPDHFRAVLDEPGPWRRRVRALRANASRMSHAELDAAETLDDGDPAELGALYAALRHDLPWLSLLGGCCGTDHRHIAAIAEACDTRETIS